MVLLVSPAAKVTVPLGSVPPKSAASARLPLKPVVSTCHLTVVAPELSPRRVIV
ncbi:hypothetical protein D3C80_2241630 [compost metagenome]